MKNFAMTIMASLALAIGVSGQGLPPAPKPVTFTLTALDGVAATTSQAVELSKLGGDLAYLVVEATSTSGAVIELDVDHEISYSANPDEAADWYAPATPLLLDINAASAGDIFGVAVSSAPPFIRLSVDTTPVANDGDVVLTVSLGLTHRRNDNGLGKLVKAPKSSGQQLGLAVVAAGSATLLDREQPFGASDADNLYLFLDAVGEDGDEVVTVQGSTDGDGPWVTLGSTVTLAAVRTAVVRAVPSGLVRFRATMTNPAGVDVTPSHAFLAY